MLTQEQKKAIYEEYLNRQNKVGDIAAKYRVGRGVVTRIAVEMGATPRLQAKYGKKQGTSARQGDNSAALTGGNRSALTGGDWSVVYEY